MRTTAPPRARTASESRSRGDPGESGDLSACGHRDIDASSGIGVHGQHDPVAVRRRPGELLGAGTGRLGDPEVPCLRQAGRRPSGGGPVDGTAVLERDQGGVLHSGEVGLDIGSRPDADEDRLAVSRRGGELHLAQQRGRHVRGRVDLELLVARDDGVGRGLERLLRAHQEAVLVADGLVGHQQCEPRDRESEGDEGQHTAHHERHDPAGRPAGGRRLPALRRTGRWRGRRGRRRRSDRQGPGPSLVAALVEPERRVGVGHQGGIAGHAQHPTVQSQEEVEERLRVATREEHDDAGHHREQRDQAGRHDASAVVSAAEVVAGTAQEQPDDQVLRDREQPPLDQDEPAREALRVVHLEVCRVVRDVAEGEGRVAVCPEGAVGVVGDAPLPAQDPDVELEDAARVAPGEEDGEEGHHAEHHEGQPQERQHHVVRDRQQPLEEPQPAADLRVELGIHVDRVRHGAHQEATPSVSLPSSRGHGCSPQRPRSSDDGT